MDKVYLGFFHMRDALACELRTSAPLLSHPRPSFPPRPFSILVTKLRKKVEISLRRDILRSEAFSHCNEHSLQPYPQNAAQAILMRCFLIHLVQETNTSVFGTRKSLAFASPHPMWRTVDKNATWFINSVRPLARASGSLSRHSPDCMRARIGLDTRRRV